MFRNTDVTNEFKRIIRIAACLFMAFVMVILLTAQNSAFAADDNEEKPKREVHKVAVEDKLYCFFVTHYVVLTPAEIAGMSDEDLTKEIFRRSGLYMKEANCHDKSHKAVTPEDWTEKGGSFFLKDEDIESLRLAAPVDGDPVKLQMDLRITVKQADTHKQEDADDPEGDPEDKPKEYSTFKRTSPRLIFIAVATEADAVYGEEICEEEKTPEKPAQAEPAAKPSKPGKKPKDSGGGGDEAGEDEMLPELRTISMPDRSGGKLAPTLEDGKPVTLEWKDPEKHVAEVDGKSLIDRIPGGAAGLTVIGITAAGLIAAAVIAIRRSREEED